MTYSRRKAIALIGGGVVVAAGAGAAGFALTRHPRSALAPWAAAGGYDEPRMRALSYAILAPNPHNRQPWLAELSGTHGLRIWRDRALNLPHTDPYDRQLTIGMGCFLELLRMAAAEAGYRLDTSLFPGGEQGPVAEIDFREGGEPDPLFAHVAERRTNRNPYEDAPLTDPEAATLSAHAQLVTDPDRVADLRDLTWAAMQREMTTTRTYMESVDLMRLGKAEVQATPDGIYLGGAFLEALMALGLLTREGLADPQSSQFRMGLDMQQESLHATPAYAVITTPGNSRADQVAAGRDWLRFQLAATGRGLASQPVSQALQEYPEMAELYTRVHATLAEQGQTVQMLGRVGRAKAVPQAPRWPLETRIKHG